MTDPIRRPQATIAPRPPLLTVQFFLRHGAIVNWPVPEGQPFALGVLATSIRAQGFFIADDLYIPNDEIACIGMAGSPAKIQQPQHPTRQ